MFRVRISVRLGRLEARRVEDPAARALARYLATLETRVDPAVYRDLHQLAQRYRLLKAMLHSLRASKTSSAVVITTATELVGDLIAAFRAHGTGRSARVHAQAGCVLVDDLHSLSGMPVTQQEMAAWAADLLARGARIACAAACPPAAIADLVERLVVLPGARVVEMRRPTDEEMGRILEVMARSADVPLDPNSIGSIAARCEGDVRRAEGAIHLLRFSRSGGGTKTPHRSASDDSVARP
jgi:chromosomal replication initiation ATPase DnaA